MSTMWSAVLPLVLVYLQTATAVYLPILTKFTPLVNLTLVRDNAVAISNRSWEVGTLAEALLELEHPVYAIFGNNSVPPVLPTNRLNVSEPTDVLRIANTTVSEKPSSSRVLIAGDGAVGDPASIGPAVLFANWTLSEPAYASAATEQLEYILNDAPRAPSGAISHRADEVQLWADFIYMAPPFIAYYGALQNNVTLLRTAYEQISLYRDALYDADAGLWRHVALGTWQDTNHWGTGNGWAAAGMLRVIASMNASASSAELTWERGNLTEWVGEILAGVWAHQLTNGTLLNYIDQTPPATFADTSSTALLAAASYRHAVLTNTTTHIPAAEAAYALIQASVDTDGWLQNTVDPMLFDVPSATGAHSPEGQSFVMLLEAARTAWNATGAAAEGTALERRAYSA
ncbi:Six-hairpin glycosidase [Amylostereum chailletii]|nr:Six-hairpin glycosidase [Amylostereum chailletii]